MVDITVEISIEEKAWNKLDFQLEQTIKTACTATIEHLKIFSEEKGGKVKTCEISVLLTNDKHIQELNKEYREKDKPTNVLSFPMTENVREELKNNEFTTLGDIILSYETIEKEAKSQNKSFKNHLIHLVIHSALHLLGYDHSSNSEAEKMENLEVEILEKLGIENPYS